MITDTNFKMYSRSEYYRAVAPAIRTFDTFDDGKLATRSCSYLMLCTIGCWKIIKSTLAASTLGVIGVIYSLSKMIFHGIQAIIYSKKTACKIARYQPAAYMNLETKYNYSTDLEFLKNRLIYVKQRNEFRGSLRLFFMSMIMILPVIGLTIASQMAHNNATSQVEMEVDERDKIPEYTHWEEDHFKYDKTKRTYKKILPYYTSEQGFLTRQIDKLEALRTVHEAINSALTKSSVTERDGHNNQMPDAVFDIITNYHIPESVS